MRTEKEIEKKIEELINDEDNFTDVNIDYIEGDSELIFDSEESRRTLKDFSNWLLKNNESK